MSESFLDDAISQAEEIVNEQRRQYKQEDFVYDAMEERYWCLDTLQNYSRESINTLIPREEWEQELVPGRNNSVRAIQSSHPAASLALSATRSLMEAHGGLESRVLSKM